MAEPAQGTPQKGDQQRQLKGTIIERDGVKFEAIESDQLSSVPVLSQALDNQWLPRNLLKEALKVGEVSTELEHQREEIVRAEYIRSLINGDQVVINRAFLFNNPIIFRDYLPAKKGSDSDEVRKAVDSREAFKRLLKDKVIVPYLFKEKSPAQQLDFSTLSFEEWTKVCREVPDMQCARLSWDEKQNNKSADIDVAGRFVNSALTIGTPQKDFDKYIEDLDLKAQDKDELKKQLRTVIQKLLIFSIRKSQSPVKISIKHSLLSMAQNLLIDAMIRLSHSQVKSRNSWISLMPATYPMPLVAIYSLLSIPYLVQLYRKQPMN